MYQAITHDIRVSVEPEYDSGRSDPIDGHYFWAYRIRIENLGAQPVRLINREWRITDSLGRTQSVRGEGVVGQQPHLAPGESFSYASGAPLATPSGLMVGSFEMLADDGTWLTVAVPAFSLDSPHEPRRVN
jgi:ApaG protein